MACTCGGKTRSRARAVVLGGWPKGRRVQVDDGGRRSPTWRSAAARATMCRRRKTARPLGTAPPRVYVTGRHPLERLSGPVGGLRLGRSVCLGWRWLVLGLSEAVRYGRILDAERNGFPVDLDRSAVPLGPTHQQEREDNQRKRDRQGSDRGVHARGDSHGCGPRSSSWAWSCADLSLAGSGRVLDRRGAPHGQRLEL